MSKVLAAKKRSNEFALERFLNENSISMEDARSALLSIQCRQLAAENNLFNHRYSVPVSLKEMAGDFQ
ncbi:hypothetical protein [Pragia fontium]|uniref:hypothetical protein n=1 Tax=Pragia fontium TaxID=82985 RepID=UPI00064A017B|nr:hypothetical protein [Pragia fontium]AKJ41773.1 hypothetical protein QQ39_06475 [Pragia fontium]